jgi:hypothetical protein
MLGMLRDDLSAGDRDLLDELKFVYDGLQSPFVPYEVERTLRAVLMILSDEGRIHEQGLRVPTSIVPIALRLLRGLRGNIGEPRRELSYAHREDARDVISRTGTICHKRFPRTPCTT